MSHPAKMEVLVQQLGNEGRSLAAALRKVFTQTELFPSTDMRGSRRSGELYEKGIIGLSGMLAIQEGRTRHRDLPSAGAVGLQLTFARALRRGNSSLLMLEQDCPSNDQDLLHALKRRVRALGGLHVLGNESFDACLLAPAAVFRRPAAVHSQSAWSHEAWKTSGNEAWSAATQEPTHKGLANRGFRFLRRDAAFFGTAAVLFSSRGRARMSALLSQPFRRIDMQIDAEMAAFSTLGKLKILVDMRPALSCQNSKSSIQTGRCPLCNLPAVDKGVEKRT